MKFKVGDVVRRTYSNHLGMFPGDTDVVVEVTQNGSIVLKKYRSQNLDYPGNHDPANFMLDQEYMNEQEMRKLLGVSDE